MLKCSGASSTNSSFGPDPSSKGSKAPHGADKKNVEERDNGARDGGGQIWGNDKGDSREVKNAKKSDEPGQPERDVKNVETNKP